MSRTHECFGAVCTSHGRSPCGALLLCWLVFSLGNRLPAAEEPSAAIAPDKTIALFNGKDLRGWTTWLVDTKRDDPRGVFSVRDGTIRISGDGLGYLSTLRQYRDYRLIIEFRWGTKNWGDRAKTARDSGIFLHSVGADGNSYDGRGAYMAAIECQVMQGSVGDLLLIKGKYADGSAVPVQLAAEIAPERDAEGWGTWKAGGRRTLFRDTGRVNWFGKDPRWSDTLGFRGARDVESRDGEWTKVECVCRGASVQVYVNDKLVNEASDLVPRAGKILLQCEGSEVFFRKVELRPLGK